MPYYGSSALPAERGVTMCTRVIPLWGAAGSDGPSGFSRLSLCPRGRWWKVEACWLHNSDPTHTMRVNLQIVPYAWIGNIGDAQLLVTRELLVKPRDHATVDSVLGFSPGQSLWGYQLEDSGTATGLATVSIIMTGTESG